MAETETRKKSNPVWAGALIAFLAIGGFYMFAEHRAHLFGVLPYLLLLLCPLMHIFMHRGHGKHDH